MLGTCQSTATRSTSGSWEASEIAVPAGLFGEGPELAPESRKVRASSPVALHLRDAAGCIQEHQNLRKVVLRAVGSGGGAPHIRAPRQRLCQRMRRAEADLTSSRRAAARGGRRHAPRGSLMLRQCGKGVNRATQRRKGPQSWLRRVRCSGVGCSELAAPTQGFPRSDLRLAHSP